MTEKTREKLWWFSWGILCFGFLWFLIATMIAITVNSPWCFSYVAGAVFCILSIMYICDHQNDWRQK